MYQPPTPLSRTSSCASISSEDDASASAPTPPAARRTRKRFTNVQLTMLENLFHQNSHPSREDREAVAAAGGMEIKSVTIWFQNKRQTERKTAQAGQPDHLHSPNVVPNITSTLHTFSIHNASHHTFTRTHDPRPRANSHSRPSLDRVASRSELRAAAPRTPSRRPGNPAADGGPPIWDNMPSSPLAPPNSPPAREFIDFANNPRTRRTLEWACAAARLADKDGHASGLTPGTASSSSAPIPSRPRPPVRQRSRVYLGKDPAARRERSSSSTMDVDVTDDEDDDQEAITPPSTWGKDDKRWHASGNESAPSLTAMAHATRTGELPKGVEPTDDDMFKAALALCGLGRRS